MYGLFYIVQGTQLYYYTIDSFILEIYVIILIIVVLTQKGDSLGGKNFVEIKDLFDFKDLEEEE